MITSQSSGWASNLASAVCMVSMGVMLMVMNGVMVLLGREMERRKENRGKREENHSGDSERKEKRVNCGEDQLEKPSSESGSVGLQSEEDGLLY